MSKSKQGAQGCATAENARGKGAVNTKATATDNAQPLERVLIYDGKRESEADIINLRYMAQECGKRLPQLYAKLRLPQPFDRNTVIDVIRTAGDEVKRNYTKRADSEHDEVRQDYYFRRLERWAQSEWQSECDRLHRKFSDTTSRTECVKLDVVGGEVVLTPEMEAEIIEYNKKYLTDPELIAKWSKAQEVCKGLTELFSDYKGDGLFSLNWWRLFDFTTAEDGTHTFTMPSTLRYEVFFRKNK